MNKSKSLFFSFLDGIFASLMTGFTLNYVVPFALLLKATNFQIGLLNALPQFFGSLVQLKTADMVEYAKSRLKIITSFVYLHSLSLVSIISLLFLENKILIFIIIITFASIFNSVATPAWLSLMSDIVDKNKYGEYFAWRGKVLGVITLLATFIAGFFLGTIRNKFLGFVILFILAGVARMISGYFLSNMEDIPVKFIPFKKFSYFQFIKRIKESNFVKYVLFVSFFNLAVFIASPFFSVYMLRDLKMSYYEYTIVTLSATISGLFFLPIWGKFADKFGNVKVIKVTSILICFLPILWLFSKNLFYLIIINFFGGYLWSGFNLSVVNFIFDVASEEVRTRCAGYFNFTNGIFIFLGTILSGYLATNLPLIFGNTRLLTLFFLSGILRFLVVLGFYNKFCEVRTVEPMDTKQFLSLVLGIKPIMDFSKDIFYPLFKRLNNK